MSGENDKTQPQELLEDVIGITHGDRNEDEKFPTLQEQAEHWKEKDKETAYRDFPCPSCDRTFKSEQALRMHVGRVHTKKIRTPKWGKKKPKPEPQRKVELVEHPLYDYPPTKGQLSHMSTMPKGRPIETLDTQRKKWSLARRRRYNAKKREVQIAARDQISEALTSKYPDDVTVPTLKYCPHCGENVGAWKYQP